VHLSLLQTPVLLVEAVCQAYFPRHAAIMEVTLQEFAGKRKRGLICLLFHNAKDMLSEPFSSSDQLVQLVAAQKVLPF
jgi:hypothetical protein